MIGFIGTVAALAAAVVAVCALGRAVAKQEASDREAASSRSTHLED